MAAPKSMMQPWIIWAYKSHKYMIKPSSKRGHNLGWNVVYIKSTVQMESTGGKPDQLKQYIYKDVGAPFH